MTSSPSLDTGWLALAALALFVAWLGWTVWQAGARRRAQQRPVVAAKVGRAKATTTAVRDETPSLPAEPRSPPPVHATVQRAEAKPRDEAVPRPLLRSPPPAVAAATPVAPATTSMGAAKTARPQAPRFERVLGIEPASAAAWQAALPLALQPAQAQAVAALCAPAFDAARRDPADAGPVLALSFSAASILRIARGDAPMLKALAADNDGSTLRALAWLDSNAASALAATLLAALAAARHLDALGAELHALRGDVAAAPVDGIEAAAGPLQATVQELWRLQREVRGNHAASVAKAACLQQVEQAVDGAVPMWRDLHARLDEARRALESMADASILGADQFERVLAGLQQRSDLHRWQQLTTRALAAAWLLRVSLGGATASAGVHPLQSASAGLRAGASQDEALVGRLRPAVQGGSGGDDDPAIEALRAAVPERLDALAAEAASHDGVDRLGAAYAAFAEGFPDASGGDDHWLVRSHDGQGAVEVRRAVLVRLH